LVREDPSVATEGVVHGRPDASEDMGEIEDEDEDEDEWGGDVSNTE
jgi:hypothetical protein